MVIRITLFAAIFVAGLVAQGIPGLSAPDPAAISIAFFSSHCQDAANSGMAKGSVVGAMAAGAGIKTAEVSTLDQACADFLSSDKILRDEALRAHANARAAGKNLDLATVKSFTRRRAAIAVAALATLRSHLSSESANGLDRYLTVVLAGSMRSVTR